MLPQWTHNLLVKLKYTILVACTVPSVCGGSRGNGECVRVYYKNCARVSSINLQKSKPKM
jgi:hypothetical protein